MPTSSGMLLLLASLTVLAAVVGAATALRVKPSLRVASLPRSLEFYEKALGMKVLQQDAACAVLGYGGACTGGLELHAGGAADGGKRGDAFVGIGVTALEASAFVRQSEQFGGKIVRPFDEYGYGASLIPDEDEMVIKPVRYGWVHDPDGNLVEVTEGPGAGTLRKVILSVLDLEESVAFYTEKLGMTLHRRRSNINSKPKHASICAFVSAEKTESEGTLLELVYNYATERLNMGTGFVRLALAPGAGAGVADAVVDPNAYPIVLLP